MLTDRNIDSLLTGVFLTDEELSDGGGASLLGCPETQELPVAEAALAHQERLKVHHE